MDIELLKYPGSFCRRLSGAKTRISFFRSLESSEEEKGKTGKLRNSTI